MKAIDLNLASELELQTLPGITPEYARRIAAGRPFRSIDDIERTGIPRSVLDRISPPATLVIRDVDIPPQSRSRKSPPADSRR
jgi:DNA uptake protein ComE-like DNA-binding protein